MKSLAEIYQTIGFDRNGYRRCDKGQVHSYIEVYETLLAPYRRPEVRVLEIGLFHGESLRMWEQYFSEGVVDGIDDKDQPHDGMADLRPMIAEGTHRIHILNAADDPSVMDQHFGDRQWDVIIEDASHLVEEQVAIYRNFRSRLAPGGVYIIEDIENIDRDRALFETIAPTRSVEIMDRRRLKNRFDDVLVVIRA